MTTAIITTAIILAAITIHYTADYLAWRRLAGNHTAFNLDDKSIIDGTLLKVGLPFSPGALIHIGNPRAFTPSGPRPIAGPMIIPRSRIVSMQQTTPPTAEALTESLKNGTENG